MCLPRHVLRAGVTLNVLTWIIRSRRMEACEEVPHPTGLVQAKTK